MKKKITFIIYVYIKSRFSMSMIQVVILIWIKIKGKWLSETDRDHMRTTVNVRVFLRFIILDIYVVAQLFREYYHFIR